MKHSIVKIAAWILIPVSAVSAAGIDAGNVALFDELQPNVFLFRDTCNVYIIRTGSTAVAVDCGDAKFLPHLSQIGVKAIDWVLFTHHHRDQCQGVFKMIEHGAKIVVPHDEQQFFDRVEEFWQTEPIYKRTWYRPDFFVLSRSVRRIDKVVSDSEVFSVGRMQVRAVQTSGHTKGQTAYIAAIEGKTLAFTGDLIYGPGKVLNFYSLEFSYDDCGRRGLEETVKALAKVACYEPNLVLTSHGRPFGDLPAAAKELELNLRAVVEYFTRRDYPGWTRVANPDWLLSFKDTANEKMRTYVIVDKQGNAFVVDPLDGRVVDQTSKDPRIKNIELIWTSHYHFDHVDGINIIKQYTGAKLYVHEKLVDVLENPLAYSLPCLVEEPIKVDRAFKHGQSFDWRGIKFTIYDFPSQTYWHDGLLAVIDGKKYFFTGDAFYNPGHPQNDNCKNYCRIEEDDGAVASAKLLKSLKPDFLVTGHWDLWQVKPEDFDYLIEYSRKIRPLAEKLIAQPEVNMGMDAQWASCYPYRTKTGAGIRVPLAVKIRNHLNRSAKAIVELRCPAGWISAPENAVQTIQPKSTGSLDYHLTMPDKTTPGRYIITANVIFDDVDYGEFAEAIVDVR